MKLNTRIKAADGRIGTICWNHLDGEGGVWGEHEFEMPAESGFGDELPPPEFMLRQKDVEPLLRRSHENPTLECVPDYEIIED